MSDQTITNCPGFEMPAPVAEHQWLNRFVGVWDAEGESTMGPDMPPMKLQGIESVRSIGFWILTEIKSTQPEMPYEQVATVGYDPEKGKYIGTVIDSMSSYAWRSEGSVDAAGNKLTLFTEGPCPMNPGKIAKFRESTEFKSEDHKIFTSEIQGEDGQWATIMTVHSRRKN